MCPLKNSTSVFIYVLVPVTDFIPAPKTSNLPYAPFQIFWFRFVYATVLELEFINFGDGAASALWESQNEAGLFGF